MTLAPGTKLGKRGPLPPDEALPIAKQIAEALECAHERNIRAVAAAGYHAGLHRRSVGTGDHRGSPGAAVLHHEASTEASGSATDALAMMARK